MGGTECRDGVEAGGPAVVLVEPQVGENVGAVARAMLNCGLNDLRLVQPAPGWNGPAGHAMAVGAGWILDEATVFADTAAAVADRRRVYAATARTRDMVLPVMTPHEAARDMRERTARGGTVGILFGPERAGLHNDDIARADAVIQAPLNPRFSSLNLAQGVLIVLYEWFQTGRDAPPVRVPDRGGPPPTRERLEGFLTHLDQELTSVGFFPTPQM
jgi:tRNA/rRNA methyltransferase